MILAGAFITLAWLGVRPSIRYSIPAVIAAILLAGVLYLIPSPRPVFASIAAGGIAYVIALAAGTILLRPRLDVKAA